MAYALVLAWVVMVAPAGAEQPAELRLEAGELDGPVSALALATDVEIEVNGLLAVTTVSQRFTNQTGHWAEGRYLFSLPDNTAVDRLQVIIGDRLIQGEVQERGRAEETWRRARDSGRAAGLVEQERANLFTTRVANIPPDETIEIRIGFTQQVDYEHGRFSLRFPTSVAPRHIPGRPIDDANSLQGFAGVSNTDRVPDASRITPPVHLPDAREIHPFHLRVDLDPGMPLAKIESSFHDIEIHSSGNGWRVALAELPAGPRRDFELVWTPEDNGGPITAVFNENVNGYEHALIMLTPPRDFHATDTPREVILIIDTSGSMQGDLMVQAKESLQFALASLGAEDRFNVIEFNHVTTTLFDQPVEASNRNVLAAQRWVNRLRAGGGTVMGPPLKQAMQKAVPTGYLRQIVFVTDGMIGNEREVLDQIHDDIGESRLFTVGIGHGVNSAFLREAAHAGRGTQTLIAELDQITRRMSELVVQLESPVLHDIELDWPGDAEFYPEVLPDLYVGQPLMITARSRRMHGNLAIRGTSDGQLWEAFIPLERFQPAQGVAAQWARSRITELESVRGRSSDPARVEDAIRITALDYQVLSSQTSLVAVDRTPRRSREDALRRHEVPTVPTHGRQGQLRAMPATDAGTAQSLIRGLVALLLVLLLFSHRCFSNDDGGES